jgi:hypothetical protein
MPHPNLKARPGDVTIIRTVTFAAVVPAGSPAVAQFEENGGRVDASLLPAVLLGREPSAIVDSVWQLAPNAHGAGAS